MISPAKYVMIIVQGMWRNGALSPPAASTGGLREITDGLDPSDRVIVGGILRTRPGAPVKPKPADVFPDADFSGS